MTVADIQQIPPPPNKTVMSVPQEELDILIQAAVSRKLAEMTDLWPPAAKVRRTDNAMPIPFTAASLNPGTYFVATTASAMLGSVRRPVTSLGSDGGWAQPDGLPAANAFSQCRPVVAVVGPYFKHGSPHLCVRRLHIADPLPDAATICGINVLASTSCHISHPRLWPGRHGVSPLPPPGCRYHPPPSIPATAPVSTPPR